MNNYDKIYIAIDLKSFYASVECRERGFDPLTTNLVVADNSRTDKTVCLAVTPSLKQYGIAGRARLFEVKQKVKEINYWRKRNNNNKEFSGSSFDDIELKKDRTLELDYIVATPRMNFYMKYSAKIYDIYLKYFSEEDIYVYSIDEVFVDVTHYLSTYKMTPRQLVTKIIKEVYDTTGITATAGIGTNLFLCKIAMDIVAKHVKADQNGVRIAGLDIKTYRKLLWEHTPITDFWRVGKGIAKRLEEHRIYTMGDIARCSIENEELLYKLFGVNAELLVDHAWGYEPCTIKSIKEYKPITNSLTSGQVLHCPYDYQKTKLILKEMTELLTLDLVEKHLMTNQIVLTINYDVDNLKDKTISNYYKGEIKEDRYGRNVPKPAHGTINLDHYTSSTRIITENTIKLYDNIIDRNLLIRKVNISANKVLNENKIPNESCEQIDLFTDYRKVEKEKQREEKEINIQRTIIKIKNKYGKNAILKGMNFENGATTIQRNSQVGGHKA